MNPCEIRSELICLRCSDGYRLQRPSCWAGLAPARYRCVFTAHFEERLDQGEAGNWSARMLRRRGILPRLPLQTRKPRSGSDNTLSSPVRLLDDAKTFGRRFGCTARGCVVVSASEF